MNEQNLTFREIIENDIKILEMRGDNPDILKHMKMMLIILEKYKDTYNRGYQDAINAVKTFYNTFVDDVIKRIHDKDEDIDIDKIDDDIDIGEISDGYHTFNQLYHQRAILFATIVNQNKDISWKSFKHADGKYCFDSNGEWFIVGIDTKEGSYTYHYEKKYWDYFKCQELECGKEYDGHTEKDVTRLLSLENE